MICRLLKVIGAASFSIMVGNLSHLIGHLDAQVGLVNVFNNII